MARQFSQQPPAHLTRAINEALALQRQGQLDAAEKACRKILKTWPDQFDALHLYGMLHFQRGNLTDARKLLMQAIKIAPRAADVHSNLGMVLAALNRRPEAMASFELALALDPNNVGALANRGRMLVEAGRPEEGLASLDKALALEPGRLEGQINRANALAGLGRHDEALREYDQIIAKLPNQPGVHFNRGQTLFAQGRPAQALGAYDRALSINPKSEIAWNARGAALQAMARNAEAVTSFERSLALKPNYADAHFNMGLSLLTLGDYPRGFFEYEWRWTRTGMPGQRKFREPLWTGEQVLTGRTLFLHAEQGLGDTVQFSRYVPALARQGARVVLQVQPELKTLMSRLEGAATVIARGEAEPSFDLHCPMGRLPLAFKTGLSNVTADIPYLSANPERLERWRARLAGAGAPCVAIAWAGNSQHANDRNRSIALAALRPLFGTCVRFISIQHELRANDPALLAGEPSILHFGSEIADLADTAAIVSLCDLTLSVDTSVAHVAGALGRPLWVMLPFACDWRWTLDRERSPWYPQARLFRQRTLGDWAGVIAELQRELPLAGRWAD